MSGYFSVQMRNFVCPHLSGGGVIVDVAPAGAKEDEYYDRVGDAWVRVGWREDFLAPANVNYMENGVFIGRPGHTTVISGNLVTVPRITFLATRMTHWLVDGDTIMVLGERVITVEKPAGETWEKGQNIFLYFNGAEYSYTNDFAAVFSHWYANVGWSVSDVGSSTEAAKVATRGSVRLDYNLTLPRTIELYGYPAERVLPTFPPPEATSRWGYWSDWYEDGRAHTDLIYPAQQASPAFRYADMVERVTGLGSPSCVVHIARYYSMAVVVRGQDFGSVFSSKMPPFVVKDASAYSSDPAKGDLLVTYHFDKSLGVYKAWPQWAAVDDEEAHVQEASTSLTLFPIIEVGGTLHQSLPMHRYNRAPFGVREFVGLEPEEWNVVYGVVVAESPSGIYNSYDDCYFPSGLFDTYLLMSEALPDDIDNAVLIRPTLLSTPAAGEMGEGVLIYPIAHTAAQRENTFPGKVAAGVVSGFPDYLGVWARAYRLTYEEGYIDTFSTYKNCGSEYDNPCSFQFPFCDTVEEPCLCGGCEKYAGSVLMEDMGCGDILVSGSYGKCGRYNNCPFVPTNFMGKEIPAGLPLAPDSAPPCAWWWGVDVLGECGPVEPDWDNETGMGPDYFSNGLAFYYTDVGGGGQLYVPDPEEYCTVNGGCVNIPSIGCPELDDTGWPTDSWCECYTSGPDGDGMYIVEWYRFCEGLWFSGYIPDHSPGRWRPAEVGEGEVEGRQPIRTKQFMPDLGNVPCPVSSLAYGGEDGRKGKWVAPYSPHKTSHRDNINGYVDSWNGLVVDYDPVSQTIEVSFIPGFPMAFPLVRMEVFDHAGRSPIFYQSIASGWRSGRSVQHWVTPDAYPIKVDPEYNKSVLLIFMAGGTLNAPVNALNNHNRTTARRVQLTS